MTKLGNMSLSTARVHKTDHVVQSMLEGHTCEIDYAPRCLSNCKFALEVGVRKSVAGQRQATVEPHF